MKDHTNNGGICSQLLCIHRFYSDRYTMLASFSGQTRRRCCYQAFSVSRTPEFFISPKTPYFGPGNRKKILLLIISYSCKYCVRFCSESKYIVFQGKANDKIVPVLPSTKVVRLQQAHSLLVFINLLSSWEMRETKNRVAHVSQVEHLMNTIGQVVFFLHVY